MYLWQNDRMNTGMVTIFQTSSFHRFTSLNASFFVAYLEPIMTQWINKNLRWVITVCHSRRIKDFPYPEPVYTGWSSVHWNATGMPLVDPVYTGTPLEKLSWNSPTLECHWRNLVESAPHWDATGETLTFTAYTGTPLEGLWQPTHAPTHIV